MTKISRGHPAVLQHPNVLSRKGWLAEQPEDFRARMLALAHWRNYPAGSDLYQVGDEVNAVFGLEQGLADVSIPISSDEMVNIHRAQPGFWIGDSALIAQTERGISFLAHTDCLCLVIPARRLSRHLDENPRDLVHFFKLNHANVMLSLQVLSETIALPPRARFARMLLRLRDEAGVVHATQAELGAMAGMSRAAFRRAFLGLSETNIVRTEYGAVRILDLDALQAEAERL
ncbi:Crp/Fnr family transcriptional regulator [Pseudoruegeria sp. SHC-113]|uniref:Crp/Fnr family transcriptional regulator n=1 Tax=Pseudoruegeria sp. SHC-113 TaxID=2855439 RepID=UPI0021BAD1E3|nr:Crp/Fnr family transcriptional regulator [Pseudoruegeria sp. SHC-113]